MIIKNLIKQKSINKIPLKYYQNFLIGISIVFIIFVLNLVFIKFKISRLKDDIDSKAKFTEKTSYQKYTSLLGGFNFLKTGSQKLPSNLKLFRFKDELYINGGQNKILKNLYILKINGLMNISDKKYAILSFPGKENYIKSGDIIKGVPYIKILSNENKVFVNENEIQNLKNVYPILYSQFKEFENKSNMLSLINKKTKEVTKFSFPFTNLMENKSDIKITRIEGNKIYCKDIWNDFEFALNFMNVHIDSVEYKEKTPVTTKRKYSKVFMRNWEKHLKYRFTEESWKEYQKNESRMLIDDIRNAGI